MAIYDYQVIEINQRVIYNNNNFTAFIFCLDLKDCHLRHWPDKCTIYNINIVCSTNEDLFEIIKVKNLGLDRMCLSAWYIYLYKTFLNIETDKNVFSHIQSGNCCQVY